MTIDRDIPYAPVAARLADADARWLARVLIHHNCMEDYIYRGPPGAHARMPALQHLQLLNGCLEMPLHRTWMVERLQAVLLELDLGLADCVYVRHRACVFQDVPVRYAQMRLSVSISPALR